MAGSRLFSLTAFLSLFLISTSGCGFGMADDTRQSVGIGQVKGDVHGGGQPITGARVYLYATGTTAYAGPGIIASTSNASTSLLPASVLTGNPTNSGMDSSGNYYVTTDATGNFSVSAGYSCAAGTDLYLYVTGGNPGAGTNIASGQLAALGPCSLAGGSLANTYPYVFVSEVSTIGTAYAVAGFATDATHISNLSSGPASLAQLGMDHAFDSAQELYNVATGTAYTTTPAGNGTVPQTLLNSLANILSACINTANTTTINSSQCMTLFTDTGTSTSLDTASVAIKIAQNPGTNVSAIFGLQPSTGAPFQPTLAVAPSDFGVVLSFTGGGLSYPNAIAVDELGNVWLGSYSNQVSSLDQFSGTTGAALSGANGYTGGGIDDPLAVAIDTSGNVWVSNGGGESVSEFDSRGNPISGSSGYSTGVDGFDVAVDNGGNVWVPSQYGSTLIRLDGRGNQVSPAGGYSGGGLNRPFSLAFDASGNLWVTDTNGGYTAGSISKFDHNGTAISGTSGYTGGGLYRPYGIAVDAFGNVWVENGAGGSSNPSSISKFNGTTGAAISGSSGYTGGGLSTGASNGIAIDGAGNVWVANGSATGISEFNNSGVAISPSTGYTKYSAYNIALDGSGNIWFGGITAGANGRTLNEVIGAAVPVITPLQYGVANGKIANRP